jgi:hypothetical protein
MDKIDRREGIGANMHVQHGHSAQEGLRQEGLRQALSNGFSSGTALKCVVDVLTLC